MTHIAPNVLFSNIVDLFKITKGYCEKNAYRKMTMYTCIHKNTKYNITDKLQRNYREMCTLY